MGIFRNFLFVKKTIFKLHYILNFYSYCDQQPQTGSAFGFKCWIQISIEPPMGVQNIAWRNKKFKKDTVAAADTVVAGKSLFLILLFVVMRIRILKSDADTDPQHSF